ncbi:hypothetical protein OGAPHI_000201 [Ogataea philodendri]|uniref:Zn(2)-C6 fungal-type domain-containing protein n=1 Tax=Ogataea philodendri TaxID=1378263 RepID=A0A9P8PFW2_9ASCO|nr:uncharacterized protein OGAPHI_000201 [Ogataea philodendri]KAH3671498.1 hypothetical protein OGAPHI_000201 [Ogataea philodendri]
MCESSPKRKLVTLLPNTLKKRRVQPAPKPQAVVSNRQGASKGQPKLRFLKSCARCRKHKIKCNLAETRPSPCTSCAKRGHDCHLETVVHVQRSTIIKNLADSIENMKGVVDMLLLQDRLLQNIIQERGIKVDGLLDLESISGLPSPISSRSPSSDESYKSLSVDSVSSVVSEDEDLLDPDQSYSVGSKEFSATTISQTFDTFSSTYLHLVPIMHHLPSPTNLYRQSPLLFWTIVYLVRPDDQIASFLQQQLQLVSDIYSVQAVVFLASFPLQHDLDIYSLLQRARERALQLEFHKASVSSPHNQNTWCLIFVLGTLHGFRQGFQWESSTDKLVELKRNQNSYIGHLVDLVMFFSRLLNGLVFDIDQNNSAADDLVQSSLSAWKHQLSTVSASHYQPLQCLVNMIHLSLIMFEPTKDSADKAFQQTALASGSQKLVDLLETMDIAKSPIFCKIALDFATLLTLKLSTTPYSSCAKEEQSTLELFVRSFKQLCCVRNYGDAANLIDTIISFQAATINYGALFYQTNNFKVNLFAGLYPNTDTTPNPDSEDPYVVDAEYRLFQQLKCLDLKNPQKPKPFDVIDVFLRLDDETDTLNGI